MSLHINALKLGQKTRKGQAIYLASVPISDLIDESYFKVDWWSKDKMGHKDKQGYQREPLLQRKSKIAKYMGTENPIIPNSILISSRDIVLDFKVISGNYGNLCVDPYPCYIVDGQTRIEGFKYAINEHKLPIEKIEMPVIFLSGFTHLEELEQFYLLNVTQKRVSTDLAQRLKYEMLMHDKNNFRNRGYGEEWEMRALAVTDKLNQSSDSSIWNGKIRLPNTAKSPVNIINQNSFVRSLQPLIKGPLEHVNLDVKFKILNNYWEALSELYPDTFDHPKDYVIQKTAGVFSLHALAVTIIFQLNQQRKELIKQNFKSILVRAFSDDQRLDYYWHKDNYSGAAKAGSMKGFARLTYDWKSNLGDYD